MNYYYCHKNLAFLPKSNVASFLSTWVNELGNKWVREWVKRFAKSIIQKYFVAKLDKMDFLIK